MGYDALDRRRRICRTGRERRNSLYTYYKEILNLKKDTDVIRNGDIDTYETGDQG